MDLPRHNENYRVPKVVFICSDNIWWALSVGKMLSALTDVTPHVIQSTEPDEIATVAESFSSNSLGCGDSTFLIHYDSVSTDVVPMCINTLVNLRSRSYKWQEYGSRWRGGYIAIVPNELLVKDIETADLFGGEKGSCTSFSRIRGHKCLFKDIAISQIVKTVANIRKLGRRDWDRICHQKWHGGPLLTFREKIVKLLKVRNVEVYDVCEKVQKLCSEINWYVFMPHADRRAIVCSLLSRPKAKTMDEVEIFLKNLDDVLASIMKIRSLKKE